MVIIFILKMATGIISIYIYIYNWNRVMIIDILDLLWEYFNSNEHLMNVDSKLLLNN